MADDLDDLLDEIESKMTKKNQNKTNFKHGDDQKTNLVSSKPKTVGSSSGNRRKDLTDALDDIFDDGPQLDLNHVPSPRDSDLVSTSRCFPLLIGGSSDPKGLSTTVSKQCCSNLRCHNCDFSIEMFDNFRWSPDIDYLFLRNNMPDISKLQSRLLSRRNSRAYACQCQWINAQEMTELTGELKRLWHCGGKHG